MATSNGPELSPRRRVMVRAQSWAANKKKESSTSGKDTLQDLFKNIRRSNSFNVKDQQKYQQKDSSKDLKDPEQASQDSSTKKSKFLKEGTRVLLKLHVIRDKSLKLECALRELQTLTDRCQVDLRGRDEFTAKVLSIDAEVKLLRRLVLCLCKHNVMDAHFSVLSSIQTQMLPTLDISVSYFGLDWDHIFKVACNLTQGVDEFIQFMWNNRGTNAAIDVVIPSNLVRNLSTLEADVIAHAEAVLEGRLSTKQLEIFRREQKRINSLTPVDKLHKRILNNGVQVLKNGGGEEEEGSLEEGGRAKGIFGRTLRGLRNNVFRKSRPKSSQSSDDLWRLWYLGVQSMSTSMSVVSEGALDTVGHRSTDNGQQRVASAGLDRIDSVGHRSTDNGQQRVVSAGLDRIDTVGHRTTDNGAGLDRHQQNGKEKTTPISHKAVVDIQIETCESTSPCSATPPPSESEQNLVLGVYNLHAMVTPSTMEKRKIILQDEDAKSSKDEELETLRMVDCVIEAPKQRVDENEL